MLKFILIAWLACGVIPAIVNSRTENSGPEEDRLDGMFLFLYFIVNLVSSPISLIRYIKQLIINNKEYDNTI